MDAFYILHITFYLLFMKCLSVLWCFHLLAKAEKKCLFKDNVSIRLSFRLLVLAWPQTSSPVLLSHSGCAIRADALCFRTRLNLLVLVLQFAAARHAYLRLCLQMTYHPVLTASGTDNTLACISRQTIVRPAQSQVKGASVFKCCSHQMQKQEQLNSVNGNECLGTVCFSPFCFIKCHEW